MVAAPPGTGMEGGCVYYGGFFDIGEIRFRSVEIFFLAGSIGKTHFLRSHETMYELTACSPDGICDSFGPQ